MAAAMLLSAGCAKPESKGPGGPGGGASKRPPATVETFPLETRSLRESITVVGSLAPNESAEIRPEISGKIATILFDEGQRVEAGQVLLRLDDAELAAQLASARAAFALAESNLQRVRPLVENRTRTEADLDRARSEHDRAAADVKLLEVRLARTELKAPFGGIVGARQVSPGDFVSPTTLVTTVEDTSKIKVEFDVPERVLGTVKPGTTFAVAPSGEVDKSVPGDVYFLSPVIDRLTRSSAAKGLLRTPAPELKPGMFVTVDLTLDIRPDATVVPESAILARQGGFAIVAVKEVEGVATADFIPVKLGLRERGIVEVTGVKAPLVPGTNVVAAGVGSLVILPGDRLEVKPLREELRPAAAR